VFPSSDEHIGGGGGGGGDKNNNSIDRVSTLVFRTFGDSGSIGRVTLGFKVHSASIYRH
jgi:hypothetical protein